MMKGAIGYPNSASERAGWNRGKMPRDSFQQELDNLEAGILDLGRQVEASLENMVRAMEGRDAELAGKELGVDAHYKARGADIERPWSCRLDRQRSRGTSGCSTRCRGYGPSHLLWHPVRAHLPRDC
jgi:hypothetical protein